MKLSEVKRWGVDIGNVLVKNGSYKDKLTIHNMEFIQDSLMGLKFLIDKVGTDNVWIISKVSTEQQELSEIILEQFDIYGKTGLNKNHVKFCLERLDKAPIIKELNLQGHIDDRGQIIDSVQNFLPCPVWFNPEPADYYKWSCVMSDKVWLVSSWQELFKYWC
jgi:hypothetical protein